MTAAPAAAPAQLTGRRVFAIWWPLAGSWLLMAVELPLLAVAMTRLPGGELHLAAFGSLVYPLSLLIEAPIIMLLAAATALSRDLAAHGRLLRFAHLSGAALTAVHALVAFTPLFDWLATRCIGVPAEIVAPARLGMQIMTPWTWSIAYRRCQQGALIRCERSDTVVVGTAIRLATNLAILAAGVATAALPGVVVGGSAVACGVLAEAAWAGWCFRRHARPRLPATSPEGAPRGRAFAAFYVPLAFTPLITIVIQPIGSWAMSNLHRPLDSLAVWPAVYGLVFLTRSFGFAYNEVVVALAGRPGAPAALRRFAAAIAVAATAVLLLLAVTPLGALWFGTVTGLSPDRTDLACTALFVALLMPGYAVALNHHQGLLVHRQRTRPITVAVSAYLLLCCTFLGAAVATLDGVPGIFVALLSFTIAGLAQTALLAWSSRQAGSRP